MKYKTSMIGASLFLGVVFFIGFHLKPAPNCPQTQSGQIQVVLDQNTGAGISSIDYRCPYQEPPILVVSPTGQGSFWVSRFEANSLTGEFGSVAVIGQPGETITINWIASPATQRGTGNK